MLSDADAEAIAERAWLDPPDFGTEGQLIRVSIILRLDGFQPIAISPGEASRIGQKKQLEPANRPVKKPIESSKPKQNTLFGG